MLKIKPNQIVSCSQSNINSFSEPISGAPVHTESFCAISQISVGEDPGRGCSQLRNSHDGIHISAAEGKCLFPWTCYFKLRFKIILKQVAFFSIVQCFPSFIIIKKKHLISNNFQAVLQWTKDKVLSADRVIGLF